jgi:glycosyltransferase involved in cell wall biosynthesis
VDAYSVITPAHNEAANLPRLAAALDAQTVTPTQWIIVENGSTDDTARVAKALEAQYEWAQALSIPGSSTPIRGGPIVEALRAGLASLDSRPPIVVSVDADVTMEPPYFESLLARFAADPQLGIASGAAWERVDGVWRQRHVTGDTVWGATRAYRWECLCDVQPLEPRLAWDGIDGARARARGWRTRTFADIRFFHHRKEGERDSSPFSSWVEVGRSCHYMAYRLPYLLARTIHHVRRDRAAIGILWGFCVSAARRERQLDDAQARAAIRAGQRLRDIPQRRREALGKNAPDGVVGPDASPEDFSGR